MTGLEALLDEARSAAPGRRIEWRDPIAAYGDRGIEAVSPWLADSVLAPFAVRVIDRAGLDGHAEAATRVLKESRKRAPEGLRGDIDWALRRLQAAGRPEAAKPSAPASVPARPARPRSTTAPRGRAK